MNKIEILKMVREDLVCSEYRLDNSELRSLTPYQLEVLEHYGIKEVPALDPIYDFEECTRELRHYSKLLNIYERKE